MEAEQIQQFNERLSQWVSSQGFWFQARYSLSGSGLRGGAAFHLLRLAARFVVFLVIVSFALWTYLVKRIDSPTARESMRAGLEQAFGAGELRMSGIDRIQGQLEIGQLGAEGGPQTFFDTLEVRNLRCRMGLTDGLIGVWEPGILSAVRLDLDLRAGADDPESATAFANAFFNHPERIRFDTIEVKDATIRWGFSERTQGSIESSELRMTRSGNGWRIQLRGGKFSQNWLNDLGIVNLVAVCDPDGMRFEEAEFSHGSGTVDLAGLRLSSGERPEVSGTARIRNLALHAVLPEVIRPLLEGSISGDLRVFGSTNSADGVGFDGQIVLDGADRVSVRDRVHLLKALSIIDYSRNYHRIDFNEGAFQMRTHGGKLSLTDIRLKSTEGQTIDGTLQVRPPTSDEVKQFVNERGSSGPADADELQTIGKSGADFNLRKAALASKRARERTEETGVPASLFERLAENSASRLLNRQAAERLQRMLRYDGKLVLLVPQDAFERAPRLRELYPVDPARGGIPIDVPVDGCLIHEVTLKLAEELSLQGRR
jgi:hypothetical protein